jgi:hypothetical protein
MMALADRAQIVFRNMARPFRSGGSCARMNNDLRCEGHVDLRQRPLFRVLNQTLIWISFIADQACMIDVRSVPVQKKHEATEATTASGKMSRKEFEKELAKLQVELVRLQTWVQAKRARAIVIFEGRDTAGKGGVISRIAARTSPRVYRHVALPTPSDREKTQVYIQRYIAHFPAAGEIILFDRSLPSGDPCGRARDSRQYGHHLAQVLS